MNNKWRFSIICCCSLLGFRAVYVFFWIQCDAVLQTYLGSDEMEQTTGPCSVDGPLQFCESHLLLNRNTVRDIICASASEVVIPEPEQSQIVFLHVPKTGGETLEEALKIMKNHYTAEERKNDFLKPHVAVGIIRNPFDRMLSWFRFCLHGWRGRLPGPIKNCGLAHKFINANSTSHTVASVQLAFQNWVHAMTVDPEYQHQYFMPHVFFFMDCPPGLHVDYIIRFEEYAADFAILAKALGRNITLKHKNSSSKLEGTIKGWGEQNLTYNEQVGELLSAPYTELYTEEARVLVETFYAQDLQIFGYKF